MDEQVKAMFEQAVADGRQEFGSFFLSRLFGMDLTYGADISLKLSDDGQTKNSTDKQEEHRQLRGHGTFLRVSNRKPAGTLGGSAVDAASHHICVGNFLTTRAFSTQFYA
jgi:hypothetical protein